MSIFSIHIHFHDGELSQLATTLIKAVIPLDRLERMCKKGADVVSGRAAADERERRIAKYSHEYQVAVKQVVELRKFMTTEQKTEIRAALEGSVSPLSYFPTNVSYSLFLNSVRDAQYDLVDPTLSKKQQLARLREQVKKLSAEIKVCLELIYIPHTAEIYKSQRTSDTIVGDLTLAGADTAAYRLAISCSELVYVILQVCTSW